MAVDQATVRRIAHLARIKLAEEEVPYLADELNAILAFVEELSASMSSGVEPMTSVMPMHMNERADVVTDGEIADADRRQCAGERGPFLRRAESGGIGPAGIDALHT